MVTPGRFFLVAWKPISATGSLLLGGVVSLFRDEIVNELLKWQHPTIAHAVQAATAWAGLPYAFFAFAAGIAIFICFHFFREVRSTTTAGERKEDATKNEHDDTRWQLNEALETIRDLESKPRGNWGQAIGTVTPPGMPVPNLPPNLVLTNRLRDVLKLRAISKDRETAEVWVDSRGLTSHDRETLRQYVGSFSLLVKSAFVSRPLIAVESQELNDLITQGPKTPDDIRKIADYLDHLYE